jgi:hypothetical protein
MDWWKLSVDGMGFLAAAISVGGFLLAVAHRRRRQSAIRAGMSAPPVRANGSNSAPRIRLRAVDVYPHSLRSPDRLIITSRIVNEDASDVRIWIGTSLNGKWWNTTEDVEATLVPGDNTIVRGLTVAPDWSPGTWKLSVQAWKGPKSWPEKSIHLTALDPAAEITIEPSPSAQQTRS